MTGRVRLLQPREIYKRWDFFPCFGFEVFWAELPEYVDGMRYHIYDPEDRYVGFLDERKMVERTIMRLVRERAAKRVGPAPGPRVEDDDEQESAAE